MSDISNIEEIEEELRVVSDANCSASWIAEALLSELESNRINTDASADAVTANP